MEFILGACNYGFNIHVEKVHCRKLIWVSILAWHVVPIFRKLFAVLFFWFDVSSGGTGCGLETSDPRYRVRGSLSYTLVNRDTRFIIA